MTNDMKEARIKNAKELFSNKAHYEKFRQCWKDYINSGKAKKKPVVNYEGQIHMKSDLHSGIHLFYNAARGKDLYKSFTEVKESKVVNNDKYPGFMKALYSMYYKDIQEVFGDTVSKDMFDTVRRSIMRITL